MRPKPKIQSPLPVDIAIPEATLSGGGSMFKVLRTLDELDAFWSSNRARFRFACGGVAVRDQQLFLRPYEWVFGNDKADVVHTTMRWGRSGIDCEFYDWARERPHEHSAWFEDRDEHRSEMLQAGRWSAAQEAAYQKDCLARTPETYRGWWRFSNLPGGIELHDWFGDLLERDELHDPNMPSFEAARRLHEQTFDDWRLSDVWEIEAHDSEGMDETVRYWRREQANGQSYYGDESESADQSAASKTA